MTIINAKDALAYSNYFEDWHLSAAIAAIHSAIYRHNKTADVYFLEKDITEEKINHLAWLLNEAGYHTRIMRPTSFQQFYAIFISWEEKYINESNQPK